MTHHNLSSLANLRKELDAIPLADRQPRTPTSTTEKRKRTNAKATTKETKTANTKASTKETKTANTKTNKPEKTIDAQLALAITATPAPNPMRVDLSGLNDDDLHQLQAAINMRLAPSEPTKTTPETIAPVRKRQPGAGRKKGEKTVVVRVPECLVPAINKLIEDHKLNSVTDLK